jgi:hypothetical protein
MSPLQVDLAIVPLSAWPHEVFAMRRGLILLLSCSFICALGCGNRYQARTDRTLEKMRFTKRLNDNLMPPAAEGKLKELYVFVRAPKGMNHAKTFLLTAVPSGQFDAEESFDDGKSSLHVLARQKTAKKAQAKKGEAPVEQAARGDFSADVRNLLGTFFNDAESLAPEKFKDDSKKTNRFRRAVFKANNKNVNVYIYKNDPYDVALIFLVDPADQAALASKIDLCLESFAVGAAGKRGYEGEASEEEGGEAAGGSAF